MTDNQTPARRTALKYAGALGAAGALSVASTAQARNTAFLNGKPLCLDAESLVLPHTPTTAEDQLVQFSQRTLTNDLATIMAGYSPWDTSEVFLFTNPDGTLRLRMTASLPEAQQRWTDYLGRARYPGGERRNSENVGRWFDLIDSQYFQIDTATGVESTTRAAFLFYAWPDGVIGQIYWPQPPWTPAFEVTRPRALLRALVAYENAWLAGDVDARLALIEDQTTCSVVRIASVNSNRRSRFTAMTKADLRAGWLSGACGRVIELERLYQVVSTFYVSAAYRLVVEVAGRRVVRETAVMFPLGPNGKFVGELSYSLES